MVTNTNIVLTSYAPRCNIQQKFSEKNHKKSDKKEMFIEFYRIFAKQKKRQKKYKSVD